MALGERLKLKVIPESWKDQLRAEGYEVDSPQEDRVIIRNPEDGSTCKLTMRKISNKWGNYYWHTEWNRTRGPTLKSFSYMQAAIEDWLWVQEEWEKCILELKQMKELLLVIPNASISSKPTYFEWHGYSLLHGHRTGIDWHGKPYRVKIVWYEPRKKLPWTMNVGKGRDVRSYKTFANLVKGLRRQMAEATV